MGVYEFFVAHVNWVGWHIHASVYVSVDFDINRFFNILNAHVRWNSHISWVLGVDLCCYITHDIDIVIWVVDRLFDVGIKGVFCQRHHIEKE